MNRQHDDFISEFAFKFNLLRYTSDRIRALELDKAELSGGWAAADREKNTLQDSVSRLTTELDALMVGRCRLKPGETRVETELVSKLGEAPYAPLLPHHDKWGRPPTHHSALESICDKLLLSFAFTFKFRRYIMAMRAAGVLGGAGPADGAGGDGGSRGTGGFVGGAAFRDGERREYELIIATLKDEMSAGAAAHEVEAATLKEEVSAVKTERDAMARANYEVDCDNARMRAEACATRDASEATTAAAAGGAAAAAGVRGELERQLGACELDLRSYKAGAYTRPLFSST